MRRLGLIGAWLATTALAVSLANTSIQLVGGSVTDSPSLRVTALQAEEQPSTVTSVSPVSVVVAGEESVPPGTAPNPSPTSGSTPNPSPVATTPDTTPPTPTTTTIVQERPAVDSTVQRTGPFLFTTPGGTVTVRCFGDDAVLAGAVPRAGYSVEIEPSGGGMVRVAFESSLSEPVAVEIVCASLIAEIVGADSSDD